MANTIAKLARMLITDIDKKAYRHAMKDMGLQHTIVAECKEHSHKTACPEAQEVTKQSTALILLSVEN